MYRVGMIIHVNKATGFLTPKISYILSFDHMFPNPGQDPELRSVWQRKFQILHM